jgi:glycosyltransferase involved in cell wall biosynthesis
MPRVDWFITELDIKGGAERFVYSAAPYLSSYGWQVRVITVQKGGEFLRQLRQDGIPCIELGLNAFDAVKALNKLNSLWSDSKPEILHTHLYHAGLIGRIIAKKAKIPFVVVHQHGLERNRSILRSLLDRKFSKWVTHYVASCSAVAQMLQKRERVPGGKISIIYNGISAEDSSRKISRQDLRNTPENGTMPIIIGSIGRLEPEKGHEDLLYGFSSLPDQVSNPSQLWLVGDGSEKERLIKISQNLGIKDRVRFFGSQETVAPLWRHINIFILPSKWEGMSMALLEAMGQGIPVIATAVGGTPEVITNSFNGLLIPANDPMAITHAIELLSKDPQLRKEMGIRGQSHVLANYTLEKTVDKIDRLYKRLLV